MERLGIYGGTFNPPHIGHMRAAAHAIETLKLDRLLLIPNNVAPHKIVKDGAVVFVGVMLVSLRASLSETICSVVGIYLIVVSIITVYKMTKVEKAARGASYILDGVIIALILAFGIWLCVSPTRPNLLLGIALILAGVRLVRSEGEDQSDDHSV